jgi:hypothetical protein
MRMITIEHTKTLVVRIEELRRQMNVLIDRKQVLDDWKILTASRKLDTLINEYNRLIDKKNTALFRAAIRLYFEVI